MNQLQKDIKVALSWRGFIPLKDCYVEDKKAFKRLEYYMNHDKASDYFEVDNHCLSYDDVCKVLNGFNELLKEEYDSNIKEFLEREDCI